MFKKFKDISQNSRTIPGLQGYVAPLSKQPQITESLKAASYEIHEDLISASLGF